MNANRSRLAASLATLLIALLSSWGLWDLDAGFEREVRAWLDHTFDLLLTMGFRLLERQADRWADQLIAPPATPSADGAGSGTTNVSESGQ